VLLGGLVWTSRSDREVLDSNFKKRRKKRDEGDGAYARRTSVGRKKRNGRFSLREERKKIARRGSVTTKMSRGEDQTGGGVGGS